VIAISTVKTHTNSIFSTLQVISRTQAIGLARDVHLLSPRLPPHPSLRRSHPPPHLWLGAAPPIRPLCCVS
jgi:hypothetical protein